MKKLKRCHWNFKVGDCQGKVQIRIRDYFARSSPAAKTMGPDLKTCEAHKP